MQYEVLMRQRKENIFLLTCTTRIKDWSWCFHIPNLYECGHFYRNNSFVDCYTSKELGCALKPQSLAHSQTSPYSSFNITLIIWQWIHLRRPRTKYPSPVGSVVSYPSPLSTEIKTELPVWRFPFYHANYVSTSNIYLYYPQSGKDPHPVKNSRIQSSS